MILSIPMSGIRDNYSRGNVADFLKSSIKDGSFLSVVSAFFTAFADTADYLYEHLHEWAQKELGIDSALVTGGGENRTTFQPKGYKQHTDFNRILANFSPISKCRVKIQSMPREGEIDLLIASDCISEGQNLQDCDLPVNYDIHWNPVRIIQRFGMSVN